MLSPFVEFIYYEVNNLFLLSICIFTESMWYIDWTQSVFTHKKICGAALRARGAVKEHFKRLIPTGGKAQDNVEKMRTDHNVQFSVRGMEREMQRAQGHGEDELIRQYKDLLPCLRAMKTHNEGSDFFFRTKNDKSGNVRFVSAGFVHGGTVELCKDFGIHVYSMDAAFVPSTNKTRRLLLPVGN